MRLRNSESQSAKSHLKQSQSRRFEDLVTELSTKFASISYEKIDSEIEDALHKIVEFLGTDRSVIFELKPDDAQITHTYVRPGFPSLAGSSLTRFKWLYSRVRAGEATIFHNLPDDFPEEAREERAYCNSTGFSSMATIPIFVGENVWGAISTGSFRPSQRFSSGIVKRMKLLGEILANALVRKRMEEQRVTAELEAQLNRQELMQMGRISAAGELVASIAHELNQPLTGILSNAQAGLRFLSGPSPNLQELQEILQDIVEDNTRAAEVIRKLRSLVKKGETEFTAFEMNSLVGDVTGLIKSDTVLRKVSLSQKLTNDITEVFGDKVQLQQVLLNLLLNGLDSVQQAPPERRKLIVETTVFQKDLLRISVQDFGMGIDRQHLNSIFQPFFTTKREGMGMGLAIAQSIVKFHRGTIWAENNLDYGATFHFTIPAKK